jgi:D-xylose transport system permease protein
MSTVSRAAGDAGATGAVTDSPRPGIGAAVRKLVEGSMRVLIVLALIWTFFALEDEHFLTAANLTNLALQIAAVGTISVGVVLVLLLGEIDLSVGAVSGLTAAVMAVLNVKHGWNPYVAMATALLVGTAIGLFQGAMATLLAIPTFVVTLAGLLAWQGAQLKVLGETGTVNVADPAITNIAGTFLADWLGWIVAVAAVAVILATSLLTRRRRARTGLELEPITNLVLRVGAAAAAIVAAVWVVNRDRGVPLSLMILVGLVVVFDVITRRTTFGRHIYAVGGNAEAARRAGINVVWIRTCVFALASTLAATGGIMAASRLLAVNQSSGGSDLLLLAIAGPVIAGVSLFGGRGTVWAALLGALVIGSISNGMDLMALESSVKFMVTGAVLLGAVALDALARQRRRAHVWRMFDAGSR